MKKLSIALVAVAVLAGCKKNDPMEIAQVTEEEAVKIEQCCAEISAKTMVDNTGAMVIALEGKEAVVLSQKDALNISKAWNYKHLLAYSNDGVVYAFEKDACEVLEKLNAYISTNIQ